jgi:curved DNA-binding protein CbpA
MSDFIDYHELAKINLYDLLNITETCIYDDIRRSFKKIASRLHPDKNPNQSEEDKELFDNIQVAYYVLSDDIRRKKYDDIRKEHQDMFYVLKNQSQKKVIKNPTENEYNEKVKELERKHFEGINYIDETAESKLKKYNMERSKFIFPKPRINEFKDRLDGNKFNEIFNKEVEDNKSYDLVKYKGESILPVGNFISLDNFEKLYINGGTDKVFKNNFSTLDEAYNGKFIKSNNNYYNHNIRDKNYVKELKSKMDIYRRDFFTK